MLLLLPPQSHFGPLVVEELDACLLQRPLNERKRARARSNLSLEAFHVPHRAYGGPPAWPAETAPMPVSTRAARKCLPLINQRRYHKKKPKPKQVCTIHNSLITRTKVCDPAAKPNDLL